MKRTLLKGLRILFVQKQQSRISEMQTNTILALVDEIHRGGTISDDFLIRVFENIGGQ